MVRAISRRSRSTMANPFHTASTARRFPESTAMPVTYPPPPLKLDVRALVRVSVLTTASLCGSMNQTTGESVEAATTMVSSPPVESGAPVPPSATTLISAGAPALPLPAIPTSTTAIRARPCGPSVASISGRDNFFLPPTRTKPKAPGHPAAGGRARRIVFLGTPEFTLPILEGGADRLVAVVAQPDKPVGRHADLRAPASKKWALEHGIPVLQPEKLKQGRLAALLASVQPDLAVVAAYGRIIPADALAVPRHGSLNVHASLLPELRGAAPAPGAIARGFSETGVTIMQIDEGLDTGDIRLQKRIALAPNETG